LGSSSAASTKAAIARRLCGLVHDLGGLFPDTKHEPR
jgi:hypothetical protein